MNLNFVDLKTRTKILTGTIAPLTLILVVAAISVYGLSSMQKISGWVEHTYEVLGNADSVISAAVDMETGMRGYLLAGKEGFLDPYKSGQKAAYAEIAKLSKTVDDNPKQVKRLSEVAETLKAWQKDVTEPQIQLRRDIGNAKTMNDMAALVGKAEGKQYFDKFRGQITTFSEREKKLLKNRRAEFQTAKKGVETNFALVNKTTGWVTHTHEVIAKAQHLLANAVDMETGMRGFLLSGNEAFLAPYKSGKKYFSIELASLKSTVSDNPAQVARLTKIGKLISDWNVNVTEPIISLRRKVITGDARFEEVESEVSKQRGKKYFDAFRAEIAAFSDVEKVLMKKRQNDAVKAEADAKEYLVTMGKNENWVAHTYTVIGKADAILSAAMDMETGMRGYLLAGKDEFLAPYIGGSKNFQKLTKELKSTVSDNPAQVKILSEAQGTIGDWKSKVTEKQIALRRKIGDAKTMDDMARVIGEAKGKAYFDKFRQLMADFAAEEKTLMKDRQVERASTLNTTYMSLGLGTLVAFLIGAGLSWVVGNGIANPLRNITNAMKKLADGDMTVEVAGAERHDEIGEMASATQVFKDNAIEKIELEKQQVESAKLAEEEKRKTMNDLADDFDASVGGIVEAVSSASAELNSTAQSMTIISEETNNQATAVASASEQASANVQTVASAAEEMTASISEINTQVAQAAEISKQAVENVAKTTKQMDELAQTADKVGNVVSMISDIAEQTNLLALNATIESARAGEAGKGFAVVASEVKALATETAKATEEISGHIQQIQTATKDAVISIEDIGTVVNQLEESSSAIAAAMEEQGATTQEISRNVTEAAIGTQEVTSSIAGVTQASQEAGAASEQVTSAAGELSQQAEMMKTEVNKFLTQVRAA